MKRFYCTICRKLKRVRKYPSNVSTPHAEQPEERIGTCNKHDSTHSHSSVAVIQRRKGA